MFGDPHRWGASWGIWGLGALGFFLGVALWAGCQGAISPRPEGILVILDGQPAREASPEERSESSPLEEAREAMPEPFLETAQEIPQGEALPPEASLEQTADAAPEASLEQTAEASPEAIADLGRGTFVASMGISYYYLAQEGEYTGSPDTILYDANCNPLVTVASKYSDAVCIEGSGKLKDGRIINYAKTCTCGRPCPTGGIICYSFLDATRFPWGKGSQNNPLQPLRSLAVDRTVIPIGTKLYLPDFDGMTIPSVDGLGGFVHDGCFSADDVGGAIKGARFDFFSGTRSMYLAINRSYPTRAMLEVYRDSPRCP